MLNLSLFDPVTLDDGQRAAIEELLEAAKTFASAIDRLVPGSADRTLAVRNVLDANVLGARAIAHRGAGLYRNHVPQEIVDGAAASRAWRTRSLSTTATSGTVMRGSTYIDDARGLVGEVDVGEGGKVAAVLMPWQRGTDRFTRAALEDYARQVEGMVVGGIDLAIGADGVRTLGEIAGFSWAGGLGTGEPHPEAQRDVVRDGITNVTTGKTATHEGL